MQTRSGSRRPSAALALAALVVLGVAATMLAIRDATDRLAAQDGREAALVATKLSAALQQIVTVPRGIEALAIDGVVTEDEFDAFARDAIAGSAYPALGYAEIVDRADRDAFVARTGLTITDTDRAGGFRPAAVRDRSFVVTLVYPLNDTTRSVLGFDLASDPARAAAAQRAESSADVVISDPTVGATGALVSISVMHAVRRPDGSPIGVVSSGIGMQALLDVANISVDERRHIGITMDGETLLQGPNGGATRSFRVADRHFDVRVDAPGSLKLLLPLIVGLGALALAVGVTISFRRDRRQRALLDLGARRSRGIAELGRRLAASPSADTIVEEVLSAAARILDARHVTIARRLTADPSVLQVAHDANADPDLVSRFSSVSLAAVTPLTDSVRTGQLIAIRDVERTEGPYADLTDERRNVGAASLICVPLTLTDGTSFGSLGFVWSTAMTPAELEERSVAAITVAELTSRAMERAFTAQIVQAGVDNLSIFARALATSYRDSDVVRAVEDHVAAIVGARRSTLDTTVSAGSPTGAAPPDRILIRHDEGRHRAVLATEWGDTVPGATQLAVLQTVTEMVSQTLARTALTDQQHEIIARLQRDLLPPPTPVEGLDVAVSYRPAMSVVGLGGDFYDVVVSESGRVHVVIGDVTGHGSEAVAVMAELKAVIQHLLRVDTEPAEVCAQADALLARRSYYATTQIASVAPDLSRLCVVNAGHPFPVLRRAHGRSELITTGHRPLLGLGRVGPTVESSAVVEFAPGDLLVLYTDGLIERRRRPLDHAMDELAAMVDRLSHGDGHGAIAPLLDDLVASMPHDTDDDIAIIGVRRVA